MEDGKRGMENALRTKPREVREDYERQLEELQEAYGEAMLEPRARKKLQFPLRQGLKADGIHVSIGKLCQWFEVPRRTVYYQPTKAGPPRS